MRLMDRLLGTDESFLLGTWQKEARRQAATPAKAATLDYNLKSLVTLWASGARLQDYARREMNGLVGQYYAKRWQMFFDSLKGALRSGKEYPAPIDWMAVAQGWARAGTELASEPRGNAYVEAARVAALPDGAVTVALDRKGVKPGGTVQVAATFTNDNTLRPTGRVALRLGAPDGYKVEATSPTGADHVAPRDKLTVTWTVTVPADAPPGGTPALDVAASWRSENVDRQDTASARLLIAGAVPASYRTMSNTPAESAATRDAIYEDGPSARAGTNAPARAAASVTRAAWSAVVSSTGSPVTSSRR
ncbi:alpha-N-acetylglucosaminidase C-terminal domain-containing protein, partial [Nonomuraea sp. RK-328]|nr:alpha-N-acetylglucosaminidase C-terminal domain-containing protein [Nonomuraea sp. RK-328]